MQNSASPAAAIGSHRSRIASDPEVLDHARRAVVDELSGGRARHVGAGEFLEHDRGLDVGESGTAVLLGHRDAEQLRLGDRVEAPLRELLLLIPLPGEQERARDLTRGRAAQRLLVLGLLEWVGACRACAIARRAYSARGWRLSGGAPRRSASTAAAPIARLGDGHDAEWLHVRPDFAVFDDLDVDDVVGGLGALPCFAICEMWARADATLTRNREGQP